MTVASSGWSIQPVPPSSESGVSSGMDCLRQNAVLRRESRAAGPRRGLQRRGGAPVRCGAGGDCAGMFAPSAGRMR